MFVLVLVMICYCDDLGIIGIEFYVMDYVLGLLIEYLVCDGLLVFDI